MVHKYQDNKMTSALPMPTASPRSRHLVRSGQVAVPVPLDHALELFTPLGERCWVPGWDPSFHYPADGAARAGAVFSTRGEDGRETLWVIVDWQPEHHRIRYSRVTPGRRAGTVEVVCAAGRTGASVAFVTYELTALSEEGEAELAAWTADWYAGYLREWEGAIAASLTPS